MAFRLGRSQHLHQPGDPPLHRRRDWLTVYRLSPSVPELNAVESAEAHLTSSLDNHLFRCLESLKTAITHRLRNIQRHPTLFTGFECGGVAFFGLHATAVRLLLHRRRSRNPFVFLDEVVGRCASPSLVERRRPATSFVPRGFPG